MNKQEFLDLLRIKLAGIPQDEIEERITFYGEMIDDRTEEGLTEEQAVSELGKIEDIVAQTMSEIPLTKLVKEKVRPSRALRAWEIVLLVLGSPIWLSLLFALFAIVISVYAAIWSVIISLLAAEFSLAAGALGGIFAAAFFSARGNITAGIVLLGAALVCAGLAVFGFFGCKYAALGLLRLTKRIFILIKSGLIKKEAAK